MKSVKQLTWQNDARYSGSMISWRGRGPLIQTGALPWRLAGKSGIEVLLITGRRSGKWLIPKGWPMPGKTLAEAAAQEAFEEAGVHGTIDPTPVGSFPYEKQQALGGTVEVSIVVHSLWVDRELDKWPESGQRKRKWFSVKEAAKRVESAELSELILAAGRPVPRASAR